MKSKVIAVVFTVFFSLFLYLGIKTSQRMFSDQEPSIPATSDGLEIQEQLPEASEYFALLILVDDLTKPEPALHGVWLSRSGDQPGSKYFFPIFPSQAGDGLNRDQVLQAAFFLQPGFQIRENFLSVLSERNLSWSQIMLLDQIALQELQGLINQGAGSQLLDLTGPLSSAEYQPENRIATWSAQASLIQDLCRTVHLADQGSLFLRFQEGFSGHLSLQGTAPEEFSEGWRGVRECTFPTLNLPLE